MFARLLGLRRQDDWANVCESTPARVRGEDYDGPTYCEDKVSSCASRTRITLVNTHLVGRVGDLWHRRRPRRQVRVLLWRRLIYP